MRFLQAIFTTLVVGIGFSRASLYTTQPVSGTVFHAGELSTVSWIDNGTSPALAELKPLKLELYGTADTLMGTLATNIDPTSLLYNITISPSVGPSGSDYYLRFVCEDPPLKFYSAKFTIDGASAGPASVSSGSVNTASSNSTASQSALDKLQHGTPTAAAASTSYKIYPLVTMITANATTPTQGHPTPAPSSASSLTVPTQSGRTVAQTNSAAGRMDMEKIKFRLVFILWPALMGITMAM